jgi:branched-chain amino acid transport system permease protein
MDDYVIGVLSNIGIISFIALSAYLLLLAGEISFGQQAFFAIGAYAAGIATALWGWPLWLALVGGVAAGAGAAALVGLPTLRLHGLYFAIATLAFAEMVRILFELFHYQVPVNGEPVGPNGADGFRDIRYIFENDIGPLQFLVLIYSLLLAVLIAFALLERSRLGVAVRMIGTDDVLAAANGIAVARCKLVVAALAGGIAALGGGLYAHLTTYVEPRIFDVMLGVHSLAYGLIGGLGTAFGPLLGVLIDIGLLESIRFLSGYRMIVFGGLVALLLIVRPRGLLDERAVHALGRACHRVASATRSSSLGLVAVVTLATAPPADAQGTDARAKADVACQPAGPALTYDCAIRLSDARTGEPLRGIRLTVGARMPSMAMAHQIRPVPAAAGAEPGLYAARLVLDMHGDWALQLDLAGSVRDRIITILRFDDQSTVQPPHHKH